MEAISLQNQFELPLVQDLISENDRLRADAQLQGTKISDNKIRKLSVPHTFKNKLLMKAGEFNGVVYPKEEIMSKVDEAIDKGLIYDHLDSESKGTSNWVGKVLNPHFDEEGEQGAGMYGDLYIVDLPCAQKLASGAKWGISPTIDFERNEVGDKTIGTDLLWKSFSFVISPAVRDTMLNAEQTAEGKMSDTEEIKRLRAELDDLKKKPKYPYKYPEKKAGKKDKEDEEDLQIDEKTLEVLKTKDAQIKELQKFREEIENEKKESLVGELVANEYLIGRLEDNEMADRHKTLMEKSTEVLNELAEVIGQHAELSAYTAFIKKYMKAHKGSTIKEAAKAWKKEKPAKKLQDEEDKSGETEGDGNTEGDDTETATLTGTEGATDRERKIAKLKNDNDRIKDEDVGMYNFLAKQTPGGISI